MHVAALKIENTPNPTRLENARMISFFFAFPFSFFSFFLFQSRSLSSYMKPPHLLDLSCEKKPRQSRGALPPNLTVQCRSEHKTRLGPRAVCAARGRA